MAHNNSNQALEHPNKKCSDTVYYASIGLRVITEYKLRKECLFYLFSNINKKGDIKNDQNKY